MGTSCCGVSPTHHTRNILYWRFMANRSSPLGGSGDLSCGNKMKKLILFSLLLTGCAGRTVHEYCQDNLSSYADYDQCYSEVSANGKNHNRTLLFIGTLLGGAGRGLSSGNNSSRSQATFSPTVQCSSYTYAGTTTTNCN